MEYFFVPFECQIRLARCTASGGRENVLTNRVRFVDTPHAHVIRMWRCHMRRLVKKFGPVEAAKGAHRDSRGMAWCDGLLYDLRFTLRGLRRDGDLEFESGRRADPFARSRA